MNIYTVEFWSNERLIINQAWPRNEDNQPDLSNEVMVRYYASSLKGAKQWCKDNLNDGGHPGVTGYFPWHFRIFQHTIDVDEGDVVPSHEGYWKFMYAMNPNGKKRKVDVYG